MTSFALILTSLYEDNYSGSIERIKKGFKLICLKPFTALWTH